ncbi:MAG TPA: hypothetical protein VFW76_00050 [Ktedonobacterales bacterium]|nr:hypothetical protein [Ktedonobacterales bacterium]
MSMNHRTPASAITCAQMELLLPLLDDGENDPAYAAAWDHLRTCASCQRERARYAVLDQAVRARFGVSSVRPHATEVIMRHITERSEGTENSTPLSSGPRRPYHISRPWLSGLGAVAVVVVLLGMAALLFGGRLGLGVGSRGGPPRPSFPGTHGLFADVSMVSPTEGWAMAQVTKTPDGKSTPNAVTFYHYQNGLWTPETVTLSADAATVLRKGGPGGFNGTISMDSATDGWAVANDFNNGSVLFHFSDGKWQEVQQDGPHANLTGIQALSATSVWTYSSTSYYGQIPSVYHFNGTQWTQQTLSGMTVQSRLVTMQVASDNLGWAIASTSGDYANPNYTVYQYAGNNTWTTHSTLNAGNLGEISGLAMASSDEGWAFGPRAIDGPSSVTAGKPVPQVLYHYSGGKWRSVPLQFTSGGAFVTLQKIVMRSAHDGWIIAQEQNMRPGVTASGIEKHTLLLHYDGSTWTEAQAPDVGGDASAITGMSFAGDGGWACGFVAALPNGQTIQDSDVPSYGSPVLWTYQNGGWVLYQQK